MRRNVATRIDIPESHAIRKGNGSPTHQFRHSQHISRKHATLLTIVFLVVVWATRWWRGALRNMDTSPPVLPSAVKPVIESYIRGSHQSLNEPMETTASVLVCGQGLLFFVDNSKIGWENKGDFLDVRNCETSTEECCCMFCAEQDGCNAFHMKGKTCSLYKLESSSSNNDQNNIPNTQIEEDKTNQKNIKIHEEDSTEFSIHFDEAEEEDITKEPLVKDSSTDELPPMPEVDEDTNSKREIDSPLPPLDLEQDEEQGLVVDNEENRVLVPDSSNVALEGDDEKEEEDIVQNSVNSDSKEDDEVHKNPHETIEEEDDNEGIPDFLKDEPSKEHRTSAEDEEETKNSNKPVTSPGDNDDLDEKTLINKKESMDASALGFSDEEEIEVKQNQDIEDEDIILTVTASTNSKSANEKLDAEEDDGDEDKGSLEIKNSKKANHIISKENSMEDEDTLLSVSFKEEEIVESKPKSITSPNKDYSSTSDLQLNSLDDEISFEPSDEKSLPKTTKQKSLLFEDSDELSKDLFESQKVIETFSSSSTKKKQIKTDPLESLLEEGRKISSEEDALGFQTEDDAFDFGIDDDPIPQVGKAAPQKTTPKIPVVSSTIDSDEDDNLQHAPPHDEEEEEEEEEELSRAKPTERSILDFEIEQGRDDQRHKMSSLEDLLSETEEDDNDFMSEAVEENEDVTDSPLVVQSEKKKAEKSESKIIEKEKGDLNDDDSGYPQATISTNELQLSPEMNSKIGAYPIKNMLAPGVYTVTVTDPFYQQKNKFFNRFRAASEIHEFLNEWQAEYSKPIKGRTWQVDVFTVGKTGEGKMIKAVEFGNPARGKHVFVIGGLRGCDWIAPLAVVHTAIALVGRKKTTSHLLDAVRFHFIPLVNVDGYHYSRRKSPATARHWCDSRRVTGGAHGVNLERNFGEEDKTWGFGKKGKEGHKDKNGFQGLTGFSEPETKAIRDYIEHYMTGGGRVAVLHVRCCAGSVQPPQPVGEVDPSLVTTINQGAALLGSNLRASGEGNDYTLLRRTDAFSADNTGQLIDWTFSKGVIHSYALEIKAVSVATHNDRYQITPEPFLALSKELEVGTVTLAQLLLQQPIQGNSPDKLNYRPKITVEKTVEKTEKKSSTKKKN